MKELVRRGLERLVKTAAQASPHDDLGGVQMLHPVTHRNVGGEVENKSVALEIRGRHQCHFRMDNLLEALEELRGVGVILVISVHRDADRLPLLLELRQLHVGGSFDGSVNQAVVIRRLEGPLACGLGKAAYQLPVLRCVHGQRERVGLVPGDIHEDRRAIQVGVRVVKLREGTVKVVGENAVARLDDSARLAHVHVPGLLVEVRPSQRLALRAGGLEFLHVLGEVVNSVTAWRPGRHDEVEGIARDLAGCDLDGHKVQVGMRQDEVIFQLQCRGGGFFSRPQRASRTGQQEDDEQSHPAQSGLALGCSLR